MRGFPQSVRIPSLTTLLGVSLSCFQTWAVVFGAFDPLLHRAVFLTGILTLAFVGRTGGRPTRMDIVLAIFSALCGVYYLFYFDRIQWRWPLVDPLNDLDLVMAMILVLLVAELTRRCIGWPILIIAAGFSMFLLLGHLMPGTFSHRYFSWVEFLDQMVFTINGIFGAPLAVAATYVYLFILFGTVLYHSGGADLFMDLAKVVAGRSQGGSAKVAVVSCGLFGMISGSPTSDAVTTGTFTIPLMKRSGYDPIDAGAIVATAATGGSIMPPVMGSAVFIMVEFTGIPYVEIVLAATIPALLYYMSVLSQVHFQALRRGMKVTAETHTSVKRNIHFIIPLVVLVWSLAVGEIPTHAAAIAIALTIAVSWLRPETRMNGTKIARAFEQAAQASITVVAATASAGIVVGAIAFSGIGGKFAGLLLNLAGQHLFPVLLLTMLICIILGMGMPVPSAYVLTAVLIAPALLSLGLPLLATHLFMIYFAVLSAITPPVAVAAYAVAGLSGGNPNRIGLKSVRLAAVAFVVPFVFIYQPELLLVGDGGRVLLAIVSAGAGVVSLAAGLEGWLIAELRLLERFSLGAGGLALILPGFYTDLLGAAILISLLARQKVSRVG